MKADLKTRNLSELKSLSNDPGVYLFFNRLGKVIYVGKAVNLKRRVLGYFQKNLVDGKTKKLISETTSFSYIEVFSEVEALILEAELIKKYLPKYNINLKDDKSHIYIVIRKEGAYKKVLLARKGELSVRDKIFGPYPDARTTRSLLRVLRRAFPFRDCSETKYTKYQKSKSPCLYGHLNLCLAPCTNALSLQDYSTSIKRLERFLGGQKDSLVKEVQRSMKEASRTKNYEIATEHRDLLKQLLYIQQSFRLPREFMENPYLVTDIATQAMDELQKVLPNLPQSPIRIECYDVSNISGKDAVCSMVVAIEGKLTRTEYRKFKIKLKDTPDDYLMMKEALIRRFLHERRSNLTSWGLPNLVVVDGGKGQVTVAIDVMHALDINIPVIGLAKKKELIVVKTAVGFTEISLDRTNEGLKLLQRLRNEAHRFAQAYHHKLRSDTI